MTRRGSEPVPRHDRAIDNLRSIRETMERAGAFARALADYHGRERRFGRLPNATRTIRERKRRSL